jgi:hypothetical protein
MKTYRILIHDRRWAEPVSMEAVLADDARACEFARQRLVSSIHCEVVEVWHAGKELYREAAAGHRRQKLSTKIRSILSTRA